MGQRQVLAAVEVALAAARHDQSRFPHALFVGPPGLGKSNLAKVIANELGVQLHETLAQSVPKTSDLAALLLEAESGQVVFIDEADELPPEQQTLLYRALSEAKLFLPRGGTASSARSVPLDDFTIVLATNHESRLARPLVERFKLLCRFQYYTEAEVLSLLDARLRAVGWRCEVEVLGLIARRSRGVPRTGLRLLESLRRTARSERADIMTVAHFERTCQIEGIDQRGLERIERAYLHVLQSAGKAVRLNVIADRLGLPVRTISGCVEPFLVREGLIGRTDDGRQLTPEGVRYLEQAATVPQSN